MIHEYALEPELFVKWGEPTLGGHFIDQFGFNRHGQATGRVVALYPDNWRNKIKKMLRETPLRPKEKESVVELLRYITKNQPKIVRSHHSIHWNCRKSWLENAEIEHNSRPFHAILARKNLRKNPSVVCEANVWPIVPGATPPRLWAVSHTGPVDRTADDLATHLKPMLRCATRILFVDPHFRALPSKWQKPLRKFLEIICDGSREVTLEYHVSACYKAAPPWNKFLNECQQVLPKLIPRSFALTVRRWQNWGANATFHDRYILTDIGGLSFPKGLSEQIGDTTDIFRLDRKTYQKRLQDYGFHYYDTRVSSPTPPPAFNPGGPPETVTISGV